MEDFLETVLSEEPPAVEPEPVIEPVVEPEIVAEPAPVVEPAKPDPGFVPIAAMLDERDKRRALEAQVAHFQAQQQPQQIPDPLDDPEAYRAHMGQELHTALAEQKFNMSSVMAAQTHGQEVVESASNWAAERAQSDPGFRATWQHTLATNPHPLEWIVQQHKRDAMLTGLGNVGSLDDWFTAEAAKRGYVSQSATVAAVPAVVEQAPRPAAPPRSIASEAPASAPAVIDGKAEFEAIFNRR